LAYILLSYKTNQAFIKAHFSPRKIFGPVYVHNRTLFFEQPYLILFFGMLYDRDIYPCTPRDMLEQQLAKYICDWLKFSKLFERIRLWENLEIFSQSQIAHVFCPLLFQHVL
jgi:hypothetical protein